jgi:hypothetical protein
MHQSPSKEQAPGLNLVSYLGAALLTVRVENDQHVCCHYEKAEDLGVIREDEATRRRKN